MRLEALIEQTPLRLARPARPDAGPERNERPAGSTNLTDLTDDSRRVTPGSLFIARAGAGDEDGTRYIPDAVARGAAAVLCSADAADAVPASPAGVTVLIPRSGVSVDQHLCGRVAEAFFDHPSTKLRLVAVTGTSGKTTTAFVIQHLLQQAGVKTGLIGTVYLDDGSPGNERTPAELTTPGAIEFSRLLARMVANGCAAAVAEVSSHALHQGRVAALEFDCGVLTNLTGDHLDYHGTMDAYAAAKAILFESLSEHGWAVVNADDPYADRMTRDTKARVIWTTLKTDPDSRSESAEEERDATSAAQSSVDTSSAKPLYEMTSMQPTRYASPALTCRATLLDVDPAGSRARFDGPWGSVEVKLPLVGRHNVQNVLQAIAAASVMSTSLSRVLRAALASAPQVPGRLERVLPDQSTKRERVHESPDAPSLADASCSDKATAVPTVLVDYAHKTDALENVLLALRPLAPAGGKLICLFGCGGDRDRTKRPKMAAVACRLADRVVITSDNPRTEDPDAIIRDVLEGVPTEFRVSNSKFEAHRGGSARSNSKRETSSSKLIVEPDRAKAIHLAVMSADVRDTVLIAGKGHEDYQIIGKTKRHFDDREHAAAALNDWITAYTGRVGV